MTNALVVLNYNDSQTTLNFIDMALMCPSLEKIIVVDNDSDDGSFEELSKTDNSRVEVISSGKNGGYSFGNNYGCRYAISKYSPQILFISNPDVSFTDETIQAMEKALQSNEDIGVIAPIVNNGYNVWNLPGFGGLLESILLISHNIHKKHIKKRLLLSSKSLEKVGVVEGSFWAIHSDSFTKINGLDEIKAMPETIDIVQFIKEGAVNTGKGTLNQVMARIYLYSDTKEKLDEAITKVKNTIEVIDDNGENMILNMN